MTTSSSPTPASAPIRRINDALYELYRPVSGGIDIDIIFFHGFQSENYEEAFLKAWMWPDDSECWLNTWIPGKLPRARVMSVSYDSSTRITSSAGRMDMFQIGENLAQSIIGLEGIGQSWPVVLVGHCIGGLVLKEVCLHAEKIAVRHWPGPCINPYKVFLGNMKGTFFFSTPNLGTLASSTFSSEDSSAPLLQYLELLSKDAARLNESFRKLRRRLRWKAFGVCEANETSNAVVLEGSGSSLKDKSFHLVEEGSARFDVDDFCVLSGENNFSICKPRDQTSTSFQLLIKFLREIVDMERMAIEQWRTSLRLPTEFVDMPKRVQWVITSLELEAEQPSRFALVGMGGIGKTTLAKAVFIRIRGQFDCYCFVEDVKMRLKSHDLHYLLATNLYLSNGTKVRLEDVDEESLRLHLLRKKVLMIMDDVESEEQISGLLSLICRNEDKSPGWLGSGSRLIITTRGRSRELIPSFKIFEVPFLSQEESKTLFLKHFADDVIELIPKDLTHKIMRKCGGLPLTLIVIGSYLRFEKDVNVWRSALEKLTKAESLNGSVDDRLWAKLRVSFDTLAPLERNMFLDLAVFDEYHISPKLSALEVWKATWNAGVNFSVHSGVKNLVDRSFVHPTSIIDESRGTSSSDGAPKITVLFIHEQLRDLGKSISRPSEKSVELCRGVWRPEDVTYLLSKDNTDDEAETQVVSASADKTTTPFPDQKRPYKWSSIARLQELRLLRLSNISMIGNESLRFPCKLAHLHFTSCTRISGGIFSFLRSDCWPIREEDIGGLHQLSVLCLDDCSSVVLPSNFHQLSNLKVLIMRGKQLTNLPESFGSLPALEVLILEDVGLSRLPSSFFQLPSLRILSLKGCSAIKTGFDPKLARWEANVSQPLCSLTKLRLEDLHDLTALPETFGLLKSLETLAIERCSTLKQLPESFGTLPSLQLLNITSCDRLHSLCASLGELSSLQYLFIGVCPQLQCLPNSIGDLKALKELGLWELNQIVSLPDSIGNLKNLKDLSIYALPHLQQLPETLVELKSLGKLWLTSCEGLEILPEKIGELAALTDLVLQGCRRLQTLPNSLGQLRNLDNLKLSNCKSLKILPESLGELHKLQILDVEYCEALQTLPVSVGQLKNLEMLFLKGCKSLQKVPPLLVQPRGLGSVDNMAQ